MTRRITLDKEVLSKLYFKEKASISEMAQTSQCSRTTIRRNLTNFGIGGRPKYIHVFIDRDPLVELYSSKGKTLNELAVMYACGQSTVRRYLLQYRVRLRTKSEVRLNMPHRTGILERRANKKEYMRQWSQRPESIANKKLYNEGIKSRRARMVSSLGGLCVICSSNSNLLLHHLVYMDDNHIKQRFANLREAETHPERFVVLCRVCHRDLHWLLRQDGRLEKFQMLLNRHKSLQGEKWYD